MKSNINRKFKIELEKGILHLDRGGMGSVLIERRLQFWIVESAFEDLGMALVYGWQGYQSYSDKALIEEIQKYFTDPNEIKELLATQEKRLKIFNARNKREWMKLLKEINKKQ